MIPTLHFQEPLKEGIHFRRLSVREGGGIWRFQLLQDVIVIHSRGIIPLFMRLSFRDAQEREWMALTTRTKIIRAGYAWNGNTPKRGLRLLGRDVWLGTPDFHPGTLAASLNHDLDFQFHQCERIDHDQPYPFSLTEANDHYLQLATIERFPLARAYHGALKDFSAGAWNTPPAPGLHSILLRS